jgi:hypothetical protein
MTLLAFQPQLRTNKAPKCSATISSGGVVRGLRAVVVVALLIGSAGCQRPLFNDKNPRSQFDTYDRLRQQNQSLLVPDEFGNPQPALRARLSPQS